MAWFDVLDERVHGDLPDLKMRGDEPMSRHTSFRIGGAARRMAFPDNTSQLVILVGLALSCGVEPLLLGNGTNLLVDDAGIDTLVIKTSERLVHAERTGETELTADAGIPLAKLAMLAWKEGLSGLEFAHGIPGSLGGAVVMNAGAYDGEMRQVIEEVTVLYPDGVRKLKKEELDFGYRHSVFSDQSDAVVLSARLKLAKGDSAQIKARMDDLMARRKRSQPLEYPSAGSTFKRPTGYFAGTLIDECGLKGLRVGGAQVSQKHAGFVINTGKATCADVEELIARVRAVVYEKKGVVLEPEVKIVRRSGENVWKF